MSRFPDIGVNLVFDRAISSGRLSSTVDESTTSPPQYRRLQDWQKNGGIGTRPVVKQKSDKVLQKKQDKTNDYFSAKTNKLFLSPILQNLNGRSILDTFF